MNTPPPLLRRALRAFFHYKLITLAVNLAAFPVLRAAPRPGGARASILVPARDEAHNLPRTLPALLRQGAHEVIVLDDGSADGTAAVARRLGARVIPGAALPPGWLGKPWACQQLARAATGDILIFTDADVHWQPGALDTVLRELDRSRADLLTVWPRQNVKTPMERLIVPLIDDVLLTLLPAPLVRLPFPSAAAGNGQLMAFPRAAYHRLGGHALVRAEVLEDVKFAQRVKARGGRLAIALGGRFVSVRMYRDTRDIHAGFGKSLLAAHADSRALLAASWAWHAVAYTVPWALRWPEFIAYALAERALVNLKAGRTRPAELLEGLTSPLVPLLTLPIYTRAARRQFTWKNRTYDHRKTREAT